MMKFLIMGGLAVIVLGGGGAGAYMYFGSQAAEAAAAHSGAEAGEEAAKGHESAAHEGEEQAPTQFVKLDSLILPIVDSRGVTQTLSLVIAIEVADQAAADEVNRLAPRLKDAYIMELYGILNKEAALHNGVVQVAAIKKKLIEMTDKVLGEGVAHDVLLQVVQQTPI